MSDGWSPPGTPTPLPRCADLVAFAVFLAAGCAVLALLVVGVDAVAGWWR